MLALLDLQLTLAIKLFAVGVDCIEVFRGLYLVVLMSGHFVEVRQRIVRVRVRGGDWNRAQHMNVIYVFVALGCPILTSFSIFRNRSRTIFVIVVLVVLVGAVRIAFGDVIVTVVAHCGIP